MTTSLQVTTRLPAQAASASAARRFARAVLHTWRCEDLAEPTELLVSELVTNAVLHARSDVRMTLRRRLDHLRIEVSDHSAASPVRRPHSEEAVTGRGMLLVDMLATSWGVAPPPEGEDGKVVWCEVGQ